MSIANLSDNQEILIKGLNSGLAATTLSNLTNCQNPVAQDIRYQQVGDQVFCSFYVFIESIAGTPFSFEIDDLPVPKVSALTNDYDCHGVAVWQNNGVPLAGNINVKAGKVLVSVNNSSAVHADELTCNFVYDTK